MNVVLFIILLSSTLVSSLDDNLIKEMERDFEYYLYTTKHPFEEIKLDEDNTDEINKNAPLKVIIHGKATNYKHKFTQDMTSEYLKKGDYNIIQVNWGKLAYGIYPVVASKVQILGAVIGRFLAKLYDNGKILPSNIHLIGHSLGAHISGNAGKEFFNLTRIKIPRITVLDPSSTLFESESSVTKEVLKQFPSEIGSLDIYRGIEPTDADIVDAMHTEGCVSGFLRRVGIADFYPNGGAFQPNCPLTCGDDTFSTKEIETCNECSHVMSSFYFIQSINNVTFIGTKCPSWKDYKNDKCNNNVKVLMGDDYKYSPEATGKFFLTVHFNSAFIQKL